MTPTTPSASRITGTPSAVTAISSARIPQTRSPTTTWDSPSECSATVAPSFASIARPKRSGLRAWDLYLNLGLAQLEQGDLAAATDSLRTAVLLGEDHPEAHFNLALAEQRCGMLADAEHETLASLVLNPDQPDARNLLGAIYAGQGNIARATLVWRDLVRDRPDYQPPRANLELLGSPDGAANGETAAELPRSAAVHAIMAER